ncbi:MAG: hypothetical protein H6807_17095 [Planctomycetes bacterium]|nr:hypothetical protein [Planctomycetota bacterium]
MTAEAGAGRVRIVRVMALGESSEALLRALMRELSVRLPVPCGHHEGASIAEPPRVPGRDQLDADKLLQQVEGVPRADDALLVCLCAEDIGNRIFSYFFGRARLDGSAVLVSLARLDPRFYGLPPEEAILVDRAIKEIRHEMGHSAGLQHCLDPDCLMHFSPDVEALDLRGAEYCADCGSVVSRLFAPAL